MIRIAIWSMKGEVGKTTLAANLGALCADIRMRRCARLAGAGDDLIVAHSARLGPAGHALLLKGLAKYPSRPRHWACWPLVPMCGPLAHTQQRPDREPLCATESAAGTVRSTAPVDMDRVLDRPSLVWPFDPVEPAAGALRRLVARLAAPAQRRTECHAAARLFQLARDAA